MMRATLASVFLLLHVLAVFLTLTIIGSFFGQLLESLSTLLMYASGVGVVPSFLRVLLAVAISVAYFGEATSGITNQARRSFTDAFATAKSSMVKRASLTIAAVEAMAAPSEGSRGRWEGTKRRTRFAAHMLSGLMQAPVMSASKSILHRVRSGLLLSGLHRVRSGEGDDFSTGAEQPKLHEAARLLQQFYLYKRSRALTRRKGSVLSTGRLRFWQQMQSGGRHKPAPFVRTASSRAHGCLGVHDQAEAVMRWLINETGLLPPSVLISVTGSAQTLNLVGAVQQLFERGLVRAARMQGTWILTGGTSTGVMKLVGDAVSDYAVSDTVTAIGFSPWGAIVHKDELDEAAYEERLRAERVGELGERLYTGQPRDNGPAGASLDANHSTFVLVDSGREGRPAWGGEIELRSAVEKLLCERCGIPMVCLVVGGGPNTVKTVASVIRGGGPVLLFAGSGGAADAITVYLEWHRATAAERAQQAHAIGGGLEGAMGAAMGAAPPATEPVVPDVAPAVDRQQSAPAFLQSPRAPRMPWRLETKPSVSHESAVPGSPRPVPFAVKDEDEEEDEEDDEEDAHESARDVMAERLGTEWAAWERNCSAQTWLELEEIAATVEKTADDGRPLVTVFDALEKLEHLSSWEAAVEFDEALLTVCS